MSAPSLGTSRLASEADGGIGLTMSPPEGFEYRLRKNGEVVITHHGRHAAVLRGRAAAKFLAQVDERDPQQVMARATGNYKRGNERS